MEIFKYKGRNKRGEILQGTIESPSPQAVAGWMLDSGISPINIEMQNVVQKNRPRWLRMLLGGYTITLREKLLFTRQMGTMVKSGVPMMQALAGIQKSTSNPVFIEILQDVRTNLDKGLELSAALSRHPKYFDDYYVSMVRVGEGTGELEEIFKRLHQQIEFEKGLKQKITEALRYPIFVFTAIAIAIAIMTLFVIPAFAKIYTKFHATLPWITLGLLGVSDFAVRYWWVVLAVLVGTIFLFKQYTSQAAGRYNWDKFKLRLPILGSIIKKATLARFCRSFATASKSGIPLVQGFTLVSRVVDNAFYETRILLMRDGVERGESMLRVAQSAGIFTPLELQMISVGEETGEIDAMLNQVADMYQEEVEYEASRLSQTVEPILLACLGILVLIMMLGIFLPMWNLGEVALHKVH